MKKYLYLFTVLLIFLTLPGRVEAKLIVPSPEDMLGSSELIITGTIVERNYNENERAVKIKIDKVLKGKFDQDVLSLTEKKTFYGWRAHFPEIGSKTMIFLTKDYNNDTYHLAWDAHNVATIDNDIIKIYPASDFSKEYDKAYTEFYRANKEPVKTETDIKKDDNMKASYYYKAIFFSSILMMIFIGLLFKYDSYRSTNKSHHL